MSFPDYLHDLEERLQLVFREMLTHFFSRQDTRLMAAIDTLTQNIQVLTDAVNALPGRIAAQGNGVTDDQLNALNTAVASLITVVNGIDPAPAPTA